VNPRLWADPAYRHDAEALLEHAVAHDVGVMAIKAVAARPWGERPHTASTWYEAYTSAPDIDRGVRFVLSTPGVTALCTPSDPVLALAAVEAAGRFEPMSTEDWDAAMHATEAEDHIFPMPAQ